MSPNRRISQNLKANVYLKQNTMIVANNLTKLKDFQLRLPACLWSKQVMQNMYFKYFVFATQRWIVYFPTSSSVCKAVKTKRFLLVCPLECIRLFFTANFFFFFKSKLNCQSIFLFSSQVKGLQICISSKTEKNTRILGSHCAFKAAYKTQKSHFFCLTNKRKRMLVATFSWLKPAHVCK